jgi:hypothetical protein
VLIVTNYQTYYDIITKTHLLMKPYTFPSYRDVCPIPLRNWDNLEMVMTVGVPPSGVITVRKDSNPSATRTSSANSLSIASTRSWAGRGSTRLVYLAFMAANTSRAASCPRFVVFATNHSIRVQYLGQRHRVAEGGQGGSNEPGALRPRQMQGRPSH